MPLSFYGKMALLKDLSYCKDKLNVKREVGRMAKERQINVFASLVNLCVIGFLMLFCPRGLTR